MYNWQEIRLDFQCRSLDSGMRFRWVSLLLLHMNYRAKANDNKDNVPRGQKLKRR